MIYTQPIAAPIIISPLLTILISISIKLFRNSSIRRMMERLKIKIPSLTIFLWRPCCLTCWWHRDGVVLIKHFWFAVFLVLNSLRTTVYSVSGFDTWLFYWPQCMLFVLLVPEMASVKSKVLMTDLPNCDLDDGYCLGKPWGFCCIGIRKVRFLSIYLVSIVSITWT